MSGPAQQRASDADHWVVVREDLAAVRATTATLDHEVSMLREQHGEVSVALRECTIALREIRAHADAIMALQLQAAQTRAIADASANDIAVAKAHGFKAAGAILSAALLAIGLVGWWGIKVLWNGPTARPPIP